jgi:hypothetical protein
VEAIGVEVDAGSGGASSEEIDGSAFADHIDRPLPGSWCGYGFNGDVDAAMFGREGAYGGDGIGGGGGLDNMFRTEDACGGNLLVALDHGDDVKSGELCGVHEHEADGTASNHDDRIAGLGVGFFQSAHDTGQGFGKRCMLEGNVVGNEQGIFLDDALGDADELGVGAVVEKQIFAEVFLTATAMIAA